MAPVTLLAYFSWGQGASAGKPSPKHIGECLIIIPHQNRLSYPHDGGAEIAGRPEQVRGQCLFVRRRLGHIKTDDVLAASGYHALDRTRQANRIIAPPTFLARVNRCNCVTKVGLLKEPLSLLAAGSALAVVHPVDLLRHRLNS